MTQVSEHFTYKELECSHCGAMGFSDAGIWWLEQLRVNFGEPIIISSGYRCPDHPIEKAKPNGPGAHSFTEHDNITIDAKLHHVQAYRLIRRAQDLEFLGIGINQKGSVEGRFIHLDRYTGDYIRPRPTVWSY